MNDRAPLPQGVRIAVAVLAVCVAACESSTRPSEGSSDDRTATRAAFQQARGRWASLGIADYQYAFRRSCFCVTDYTAPVRIGVRQGEVAEVVSTETGQPRATEGYPTVDDLFARLQEALDSNAENVQATYDPGLGYPTSFFIDQDTRIADEELWVETSSLERRP